MSVQGTRGLKSFLEKGAYKPFSPPQHCCRTRLRIEPAGSSSAGQWATNLATEAGLDSQGPLEAKIKDFHPIGHSFHSHLSNFFLFNSSSMVSKGKGHIYKQPQCHTSDVPPPMSFVITDVILSSSWR